MDINKRSLLTAWIAAFFLFLLVGFTSKACADSIQATVPPSVGHYHPHQPPHSIHRGDWGHCHGHRGGMYWNYYPYYYRHGVRCQKSCLINRWNGAIIRCKQQCYPR